MSTHTPQTPLGAGPTTHGIGGTILSFDMHDASGVEVCRFKARDERRKKRTCTSCEQTSWENKVNVEQPMQAQTGAQFPQYSSSPDTMPQGGKF